MPCESAYDKAGVKKRKKISVGVLEHSTVCTVGLAA